jgi:pimeloyl-ACP methyl ester carboxylesterase
MSVHPSPSPTRPALLAGTDVGAGGPALLFVPGWCGDRSVFDGLVTPAGAHRRAVSVDLPGHGDSPDPGRDFGTTDVVDALVALVADAGLERVVPVGLSHAGWAAIGLRRRLGAERVPGVVLLDWMVLGTPPGFEHALAGLQGPAWADVRHGLQEMWSTGVDVPAVHAYVASMGAYGATHWNRAGREIAASFAASPVPLDVLAALQPCPTLHLYAQPGGDDHLAAQRAYAAEHPWFSVRRVHGASHFPMLETPDEMAAEIEAFVRGLA